MVVRSRFWFRLRDIVLCVLALAALWPLLLLIAISLQLTQKRVIFSHLRPGLYGKPFRLYKFSTMRDAPPGWDEAERQRERLTPVGKWLRELSLDELPQLWNVLKGDMSLVGPRPLLMDYLPLYTPEENRRHEVLPGITGWAQVNGRNALTFKAKFALDVWYVDHQSLWLDIEIMWMTVYNVLKKKDVYLNDITTMEKFNGNN